MIDFDFSGISGNDKDSLIESFAVAVNKGIANFISRYPDFEFNPSEANRKLLLIFSNQVLLHMNEMALNLVLHAKLNSMFGVLAEMQKSL